MKITHRFFGFLYSFALILILLVTAFDVACYGRRHGGDGAYDGLFARPGGVHADPYDGGGRGAGFF